MPSLFVAPQLRRLPAAPNLGHRRPIRIPYNGTDGSGRAGDREPFAASNRHHSVQYFRDHVTLPSDPPRLHLGWVSLRTDHSPGRSRLMSYPDPAHADTV